MYDNVQISNYVLPNLNDCINCSV